MQSGTYLKKKKAFVSGTESGLQLEFTVMVAIAENEAARQESVALPLEPIQML